MKRRGFFKTVGAVVAGMIGLSTRSKAAEVCKPTDVTRGLGDGGYSLYLCTLAKYPLPLFTVTTEDGHNYKLYLNGKTEGFPKGCRIINRAVPVIMSLEGKQYLRSKKALNSMRKRWRDGECTDGNAN